MAGMMAPKDHAKPKNDATTQRNTQVPDTQAISQSTDAPENAKKKGDPQYSTASTTDDLTKPGDGEVCGKRGNNQPGEKSAYNPVRLPLPAFYFFIWDIETARGKATDEMKNNYRAVLAYVGFKGISMH